MMPAKSCYSCYFGGTRRGPECEVASTAVCCEEWIAPKIIKVRAVIEGEIDIRAIELAYQEKFQDIEAVCSYVDISPERYLLGLLQPDGLDEISITQIEQLSDEGEGYPVQRVKQREVIVA